jgi:hypothetical protein
LAAILVGSRDHRTQFWKGAIIPIQIFLSETICSIRTKFWWNSHWMVLFQICVRWFGPSTKMAGVHPRFIPPKFCCNWPSGFWGEDFYVNFP